MVRRRGRCPGILKAAMQGDLTPLRRSRWIDLVRAAGQPIGRRIPSQCWMQCVQSDGTTMKKRSLTLLVWFCAALAAACNADNGVAVKSDTSEATRVEGRRLLLWHG